MGKTATFAATVTGTGSYSSAVTWTASAGTITTAGVFTAPNTAGTVTVTATSSEDPTKSGSAAVTVTAPPLAVCVSASATTVNTGGAATVTATVTGGEGNATVTWSAPAGTFSPATGASAIYTAPATVPSPATVVITATVTDSTGSVTGTVTITVQQRTITIAFDPSVKIFNSELYSDFGQLVFTKVDCTGCQTGDMLNVQPPFGSVITDPYQGIPWSGALNFTGIAYVPGPIKIWVTGTDGVQSNALVLTFDGSEDIAVQDPSSGEIYYYYSGNGTQGSSAVLKFKVDGTADGSFTAGGYGIAVDDKTHDVLFASGGGAGVFDPNGKVLGLAVMGNTAANPPITNSLAVDSKNGLACATQPAVGTAYCFYPPTMLTVVQAFPLPNLPSDSQPTAIKVLDATHVVLYGRGDQTLRWFTISGTTATAAGTLQLQEFTATNSAYWSTYPATGGWDLALVNGTLGIMGQVVNPDGTVSQKLALVNNANQTLIQYLNLPQGIVHVTADPTNNAIVAEYPDFSVSPLVMRFLRIYVDTGNEMLLQSTSTLAPGAGFFVTNDGSHIAVFVGGKTDFLLNQ